MAKIIKKKLVFAPDPFTHCVYWVQASGQITYDAPSVEVPKGITEVVLPDDFPPGAFEADTDYILGVTAKDDAGNESDMVMVTSPFDFTPPPPPSGVSLVNA